VGDRRLELVDLGSTGTRRARRPEGHVSQLLTDFGRTGASLARAGDLADASVQSARSSRVEVVFAAEVAYFNVLRALNLQGVRSETLRQREALLRQAQAFFDAGLKARIGRAG
jgi:outer membrane protein TolC